MNIEVELTWVSFELFQCIFCCVYNVPKPYLAASAYTNDPATDLFEHNCPFSPAFESPNVNATLS